jgi:hypothetical protein
MSRTRCKMQLRADAGGGINHFCVGTTLLNNARRGQGYPSLCLKNGSAQDDADEARR